CLQKMDDIASGGRTVLFVSHNLNSVQRLCTRCMRLDGGRIVADGPAADVTREYLRETLERTVVALPDHRIDLTDVAERQGTDEARFESVRYVSNSAVI